MAARTDAVVYLVEDDAAVRDSLKMLLELHGLVVEDFASAEEFSRRHVPGRKACMVLDLHLPGQSGLDFLASRQSPGVPVIMVSARGDAAARARAAKAGVVAFLDKPIDGARLVDHIREAVAG